MDCGSFGMEDASSEDEFAETVVTHVADRGRPRDLAASDGGEESDEGESNEMEVTLVDVKTLTPQDIACSKRMLSNSERT